MPDTNFSTFIWSIAELLRNDYKQSEYGKVILPLTLLRRLDQVLESTKDKVLKAAKQDIPDAMRYSPLTRAAGFMVQHTSRFTFDKLLGDADHLQSNLLFHDDDLVLGGEGQVRTLYDPCAGTGGMLSIADEYIKTHNPNAQLALFGQEVNAESYAIRMREAFASIGRAPTGDGFFPRRVA